jgi:prepilin-type processing-associated H-X9-DG protein
MSNLRQIGVGIIQYTTDNDGKVPYIYDPGRPGEEFWYDAVCKSLGLPQGSWWSQPKGLFYCPAAKTKTPNYTMSWAMTDRRIAMVTNSSQRVIVADGDGASGAGINESPPFGGIDAKRHKSGANYLFVDSHVELLAEPPTNGLIKPSRIRETQSGWLVGVQRKNRGGRGGEGEVTGRMVLLIFNDLRVLLVRSL